MTIPYNHKTDIALDCLQTFVATYEALIQYCKEEYESINPRLAAEIQNRINKYILSIIEDILKDSYPRAS